MTTAEDMAREIAARARGATFSDEAPFDAWLADQLRSAFRRVEAETLERAAQVADATADRCRDYAREISHPSLVQREIAASASLRMTAGAIRSLMGGQGDG